MVYIILKIAPSLRKKNFKSTVADPREKLPELSFKKNALSVLSIDNQCVIAGPRI